MLYDAALVIAETIAIDSKAHAPRLRISGATRMLYCVQGANQLTTSKFDEIAWAVDHDQ